MAPTPDGPDSPEREQPATAVKVKGKPGRKRKAAVQEEEEEEEELLQQEEKEEDTVVVERNAEVSSDEVQEPLKVRRRRELHRGAFSLCFRP